MALASATDFFRALWAEATGWAEIRLLLEVQKNKHKSWPSYFRVPDELGSLVHHCEKWSGKKHVYFGVGLTQENLAKEHFRKDVATVTCLWTDIDLFKRRGDIWTPRYPLAYPQLRDKIKADIKRLTDIVPCSIAAWSGAGFHVYWLLKEPLDVFGKPELISEIEATNLAIAEAVGGECWNVGRILRVPGSKNIKGPRCDQPPDAAAETKIVAWYPERRYDLSHFSNLLPVAECLKKVMKKDGPAVGVPPTGDTIDVDAMDVPDTVKKVIRGGLAEYVEFRKATDSPEEFAARQHEGKLTRSEADAWLISTLIKTGFTDQQIFTLYRDSRNGISEKYAERGDSYLSYTIAQMRRFASDYPRVSSAVAAERVGNKIEKRFDDGKIDVLKIAKVAYDSPIYDVYTKDSETSEELKTHCTLEELGSYHKFRLSFLAQHDRFPPEISQQAWEDKVNKVMFEVELVNVLVAGPQGEVRAALEEFLSGAQPETKASEVSISYLPITDPESGAVYLKTSAFLQYLHGQKIEAKRRVVVDVLRTLGYELMNKRFGRLVTKVWGLQNSHAKKEENAQKTA